MPYSVLVVELDHMNLADGTSSSEKRVARRDVRLYCCRKVGGNRGNSLKMCYA